MVADDTTVYAVIPTYNRVVQTMSCLAQVIAQSHPHIVIIVSDGGSTDGTQESARRISPAVHVLSDKKELWWSGAVARGIDWALKNGATRDDYILMLNDDTDFDADLVESLVEASREFDAAVAAVTVDSKAPSVVLDAGTYIDWQNYNFLLREDIEEGAPGRYDVDVLPGRATLIPVYMIREAGNVDARRFPHYIGDYEFTYRLKQSGFRLGVTYKACIRSHSEMTGVSARAGKRYAIREYLSLLASRRSMTNFIDHYRFIMRCGPKGQRAGILGRVFKRAISNGFRRLTRGDARLAE